MAPSFVTPSFVTVPPGTSPGQTVHFQDPATKQTLQVAVPPGVGPGQTFQVQVASGSESSQSDIEAALKTAQTSVAIAAFLIKGTAKASIMIGKAAYKGAKYAHEKGWDQKAAKFASTGGGKVLIAGAGLATGASLYDVSMDAAFDKHTAPKSGKAPAPAPAPAAQAGGGSASSGSVMWVVVPPNAGPGMQICVITPSGQQCTVEVPDGATAGTQFCVQLAPGA